MVNLIKSMIQKEITKSTINVHVPENEGTELPKWLNYGKVILTQKDKTVLTSGRKLSDIHINAAQEL